MRSKLFRALALAGALTALSIPVASATHVAACSTGSTCSTSSSGTGSLDSFVSPLSVSSPTSNIERPTSAQTTAITLTGYVGFSVTDPRGNDQGFAVSLSTSGYSSSLVSTDVSASDVSVVGTPSVDLTCFTREALVCAPAMGYYDPSAQSESLDTTSSSLGTFDGPIVAVQCPLESIGFGVYSVMVPIQVSMTGMTAELFGSLPFSYDATYTATVYEGGLGNSANPFSFVSLGCPSETPAPVTAP